MKVNCCDNCVVDPMCTVGCDDFWVYYKSLEQTNSKRLKIMGICVKIMVTMSISHGIAVLTGISVASGEDKSYYVIEYFGIAYWYWSYLVVYMIPFIVYLYVMIQRIRVKKMIIRIDSGKRQVFICEKKFEEVKNDLL